MKRKNNQNVKRKKNQNTGSKNSRRLGGQKNLNIRNLEPDKIRHIRKLGDWEGNRFGTLGG
jgi:hypothetical protein